MAFAINLCYNILQSLFVVTDFNVTENKIIQFTHKNWKLEKLAIWLIEKTPD